jgi:tetratricopeptide (TPR) repeat protein
MFSVANGAQLCVLLCALGWLSSADADDTAAAKRSFEKGSIAFDIGHFQDAAHLYETAYQAKPDPVLLYNIGQAYRLAGATRQALHVYRSYLRRAPSASNTDEVEERVTELQRLVDADEAAVARSPLSTFLPNNAPVPAAPTNKVSF